MNLGSKGNSLKFGIVAAALFLCLAVAPAKPDSQDIDRAMQHARTLEAQGKLAEATQAWRAIVERNPSNIPALSSLGVLLARQRKYQEAASSYKKALAIDSRIPEIQLNLGLAYFKLGNFRAAVAPFRAALELMPSRFQAKVLLGMSYYGAGMYRDAATQLEAALAAEPNNLELRHMLAESYLWGGEYRKALREFETLLRESPQSAPAHILLGEALDGLGRHQDAIAEFQSAAKNHPKEPNVHFGLGYLYWKERLYDEAVREFEAELANDPAHSQATAYLGDISMRRGDLLKAREHLQKAIRLRKDIRIAHFDLGIIDSDQKQYARAEMEFKQAIQIDPTKADSHYRLASVYRALGRNEDAARELAQVKRMHGQVNEDLLHKISGPPPAPKIE
jgi:tetratricopeptide (TPR) repeat protein